MTDDELAAIEYDRPAPCWVTAFERAAGRVIVPAIQLPSGDAVVYTNEGPLIVPRQHVMQWRPPTASEEAP